MQSARRPHTLQRGTSTTVSLGRVACKARAFGKIAILESLDPGSQAGLHLFRHRRDHHIVLKWRAHKNKDVGIQLQCFGFLMHET